MEGYFVGIQALTFFLHPGGLMQLNMQTTQLKLWIELHAIHTDFK